MYLTPLCMSGTKCTLFCLKREKELACFRDAGTVGAEGAYTPQILTDQLTLSQPGGQIMPPPSDFKTFRHLWLAWKKNTEVQSKETETEKVHLYKSAMTFFFPSQFLFFFPSLSPSAFCSSSSALCIITMGWNHFWSSFSCYFCLHEIIFLQIWYKLHNGIKVVLLPSDNLDGTIHMKYALNNYEISQVVHN